MHTSHATQDGTRTGWFKSSYSPSQESCVETRFDGGVIHVRDSKNLHAVTPVLTVGTTQWATFLDTLAGDATA